MTALSQIGRGRPRPRPRLAPARNLPRPAAGAPPAVVRKATHARAPKFRWQGVGATYDHLNCRGNAAAARKAPDRT